MGGNPKPFRELGFCQVLFAKHPDFFDEWNLAREGCVKMAHQLAWLTH